MSIEKLRECADLRDRKAALRAEIEEIDRQLAEVEPAALEYFTSQGIQNVRLEDGRTVYLRRDLWPKQLEGYSVERLAEALRECGAGDLVATVAVNQGRFAAWCREVVRDGQPLPEPIAAIVDLSEKWSVRTTR